MVASSFEPLPTATSVAVGASSVPCAPDRRSGPAHRVRRPAASSLTSTPGRACCHGLSRSSFSKRLKPPLGRADQVLHRRIGSGASGPAPLRSGSPDPSPRSAALCRIAFRSCPETPCSVVLSWCCRPSLRRPSGKPSRRHDQRDDHLHTIRPLVAASSQTVVCRPLGNGGSALEVGAGQIVEQHVEVGH